MTEPDLNLPATTLEVSPASPAADGPGVARRPSTFVTILAFAILLTFLTFVALKLQRSQQGSITTKEEVPTVTLTSFDGVTYNTADLKGKVLVINFWASWCNPCALEAAEMELAWQNYKASGKVLFLGVDYVDTEPEARAYLAKFNITYPNGPDLGTRISQMFRMTGVPETYIIDQNGKLANKKIGPFDSTKEIINMIDPLLKKQ
jgi:cytochrome c biogenesis protein CcmG/thiol:disulfide interchange protein DsbE